MNNQMVKGNGDMQPFVDALKSFFYVSLLDNKKEDETSFQDIVSVYLAQVTARLIEAMTHLVPNTFEQCALPGAFLDSTSATVSFAGSYSGSVSIHCPTDLAEQIVCCMTGLEGLEAHEGVYDALGELANVLAGEIKQALSASGLDIQLSMPDCVSGTHYLLSAANHHNTVTISSRLEGQPLYISLVAERNRLLYAVADELRSKREWLALALEGGGLGLWDWELASGKAHFSSEWASMLGYAIEDLFPDVSTWESLVHPEDMPEAKRTLQEHFAGNSACYEAELRMLSKGGEWIWVLTRGRVLERKDDGSPVRIAGSHLDITGRKRIEQALQESRKQLEQMNAQLEDRVAEEVLKNREKDSCLLQQEKLASIGQLAAGVAHEINNPMGFIMGNLNTMKEYMDSLQQYCRLVDERLAGQAHPELQQAKKELDLDYILNDLEPILAESTEGAERVRRIVLDLKDFARPDEQAMHDADLNQLVQSTINIVRNELKYVAQLDLQLGELPRLVCHPQQINQVISNLLINAAHAIEQQGVITVRTWQENRSLLLSVSDTGKGILPELRNRIFDPFFTTKEVGKGTGLGLSIIYDIIKKHSGEITLDSQVGVGSTFTVRLPIDAAA